MEASPLTGSRIGLFGRGGSGKSTCTVLLARALAQVLVVVDPSYAGVQMAITMKTLVEQMQAGQLPATAHLASPELVAQVQRAYATARTKGVVYVLNKLPDPDTEHVLWQQLMTAGITPVAVIPEDPALREAWLTGGRVESTAATAEAAKIVRTLERMTRETAPAPA